MTGQRHLLPDKLGKDQEDSEPPAYFSPSTLDPSASTANGPDVERLLPVPPPPPPPPPPAFPHLYSSTSNAATFDSDRAELFCHANPLWQACVPPGRIHARVQAGDVSLIAPPPRKGEGTFHGKLSQESGSMTGRWKCQTDPKKNGDCLLRTQVPLYFAARDDPSIQLNSAHANHGEKSVLRGGFKTIYFEVTHEADNIGSSIFPNRLCNRKANLDGTSQPSGVSIGYVAMPYPSWRSPGWERGGLGVFSDDGHKFINNSLGGKEFTAPFRRNERLGIGLKFSASSAAPYPRAVDVFFTRNGTLSGSWDLFEPVDQMEGGVEGLEGGHDIYGAIGLWGGVKIKAYFNSRDWLFDPSQFQRGL